MNHIELGLLESAALAKNPFETWCEKVEKILGHDLDGDIVSDGYALDDAFDWYEGGDWPETYAERVLIATGRCIRCHGTEVCKDGIRYDHCSECRDRRDR
jgi:hypothetical protein